MLPWAIQSALRGVNRRLTMSGALSCLPIPCMLYGTVHVLQLDLHACHGQCSPRGSFGVSITQISLLSNLLAGCKHLLAYNSSKKCDSILMCRHTDKQGFCWCWRQHLVDSDGMKMATITNPDMNVYPLPWSMAPAYQQSLTPTTGPPYNQMLVGALSWEGESLRLYAPI